MKSQTIVINSSEKACFSRGRAGLLIGVLNKGQRKGRLFSSTTSLYVISIIPQTKEPPQFTLQAALLLSSRHLVSCICLHHNIEVNLPARPRYGSLVRK